MATFAEIEQVRLSVSDPMDVISIISIADKTALPTEPDPQTAYRALDTKLYYITELEDNVATTDYTLAELQVSDARIETFIDGYGASKAIRKTLRQIIARIGTKISIAKETTGSEDIVFTSLIDTYEFYKGLYNDYKEEEEEDAGGNSGKVGTITTPQIAGGNI